MTQTITKSVNLVYPDFYKAYDIVPNDRQMAKFNAPDIQGDAVRWIRCWLTRHR